MVRFNIPGSASSRSIRNALRNVRSPVVTEESTNVLYPTLLAHRATLPLPMGSGLVSFRTGAGTTSAFIVHWIVEASLGNERQAAFGALLVVVAHKDLTNIHTISDQPITPNVVACSSGTLEALCWTSIQTSGGVVFISATSSLEGATITARYHIDDLTANVQVIHHY